MFYMSDIKRNEDGVAITSNLEYQLIAMKKRFTYMLLDGITNFKNCIRTYEYLVNIQMHFCLKINWNLISCFSRALVYFLRLYNSLHTKILTLLKGLNVW